MQRVYLERRRTHRFVGTAMRILSGMVASLLTNVFLMDSCQGWGFGQLLKTF